MGTTPAMEGAVARRMPLRRAATLTARLGILQSILTLAAYWLLAQAPGPGASDEAIVEFYNSDERWMVIAAGLYLMPFAGIAFLWFVVALRMWIKQSSEEHALFSNVQLVSAIVFIALFFAAAAAESVLAVSVDSMGPEIEPTMARLFPRYGGALLLVFAMRMAAVFVVTTSTIGRLHRILPAWFVWTGYAVGLFLLLSATISPLLILVFPVWVLVLSVILLGRARQLPKESSPA
jgi:hypothetical protein